MMASLVDDLDVLKYHSCAMRDQHDALGLWPPCIPADQVGIQSDGEELIAGSRKSVVA